MSWRSLFDRDFLRRTEDGFAEVTEDGFAALKRHEQPE
jgi:hypothetical protein